MQALIVRGRSPALVERLIDDGDLHAPHLLDVEVLHALRRLNARGLLSDERAWEARVAYGNLSIQRYPHVALSDRMWELRHNLTAYDAAFVTLAELLAVPLLTCDRGLHGAPGHQAAIELY